MNNVSTKYESSFPLCKIELSEKYQIRKTSRDTEEFNELLTKIKDQGQIEPIHILLDKDKKYYILAGFGRFAAMKKLGYKHCQVLIRENLSDIEIVQVVYGTNAARSKLSEWDVVCAVGEFRERNPFMSGSSRNINETTVSKVFGMCNADVVACTSYYMYFKKVPQLFNLFNSMRLTKTHLRAIYYCLKTYRADVDYDVNKVTQYIKNFVSSGIPALQMELTFPVFMNEHMKEYKHLKQGDNLLKNSDMSDVDNLKSFNINMEYDVKQIESAKKHNETISNYIDTLDNMRKDVIKILTSNDFKLHGDITEVANFVKTLDDTRRKVNTRVKQMQLQRDIIQNMK